MIKAELRKLRTLNATPEMIQKAKSNEPTKAKDEYGYKYKRNYAMFFRVQQLNGYVKVAVFLPDEMEKDIKDPHFEIFLNPKGEEFITREFTGPEREEKWRTAMIENLDYYNAGWNYLYYSQHKAWVNQDGRNTIHGQLKEEGDVFWAIQKFQQKVRDEQARKRRERQTAPWDADMKLVPRIPKHIDQWLKKEVPEENFIFYEYSRKGEETGYCTYCQKEVPLKNPKHNKKGICTNCHKKIQFKSRGKASRYLQTKDYGAYYIQKIKDGFVVRLFFVKILYEKHPEQPKYFILETERVLFTDKGTRRYSYEMYKNIEMRWVGIMSVGHNRYYETKKRVRIQKGIPEIEKSVIPVIHKKDEKYDPVYILSLQEKFPVFEKAVKAGLADLGYQLARAPYNNNTLLDESQGELARILVIDRMRLKRLAAMNGNLQALIWFQTEKRDNTVYQDEMIKGFSEAVIYPADLDFISDRMSYQKIYNYMVRQCVGEGLGQIRQTWEDYLEMAEKLKMDTRIELIYKPKNLKRAHDELVRTLERGGIKKKAEEIRKKFPGVDEVCSSLQKYEYQSGKFCIVAPKGIYDIVEEGTILHHCIHTCDIYFDRITNKESYLLFLRQRDNPGMPWYTLEVEPGGNIRQKRTTGDCQNEDFQEALPFLKKWQKEVQKRLDREDAELAEKSSRLRQENYSQLRKDKKVVWHGRLQGKLLADVLEADFMEV